MDVGTDLVAMPNITHSRKADKRTRAMISTSEPPQLISVALRAGGRKRVRAQVFGKLALHASVNDDESLNHDGWLTITHIPTGYEVLHVQREDGAALIKAFGHLDWNFTLPKEMPERTRNRANAIIQKFLFRKTHPKRMGHGKAS
jgi:hypothetical protein